MSARPSQAQSWGAKSAADGSHARNGMKRKSARGSQSDSDIKTTGDMKKIGNIDLTRATKAAHVEFIHSVCIAVDESPEVTANAVAKKAAERLKAAYDEERENLILSNKSLLTDDIHAADTERDGLFTGFKGTVMAQQRMPDAAKAEAARELTQRIKDYRLQRGMQLDGETAMIGRLVEDCEGVYASHVERLGVGPYVVAMKAANERVHRLINERMQNQRLRKEAEVDMARRQSDAAYRWLVEVVNAMQVLLGDEAGVGHFIDFMNALIKRYRQVVFAKRKRNKDAAVEG